VQKKEKGMVDKKGIFFFEKTVKLYGKNVEKSSILHTSFSTKFYFIHNFSLPKQSDFFLNFKISF